MGGFTPGPWRKSIASRPGTAYSIAGTVGTAGEIAEVKCIPEAWGDHIANARLIAAAPELYNACQLALKVTGGSDHWDGETKKFLLAIEAAIRKARGKS